MRLPASLKWIGLALLGLLIATAVALAATGLISRQIGIDSESISAGDTLAPAFGHAGERQGGKAEAGKPDGGSPSDEGSAGGPEVEPELEWETEPEVEAEPETQGEPQTGSEASESGPDDGQGGGGGKAEGADD